MIHFYKRNNVQTESDRLDRPERELDPSSQKFLSEVCTTLKRHENQHLEASESGVRSQIFLSGFGGAEKQ